VGEKRRSFSALIIRPAGGRGVDSNPPYSD
jgi:hypothetical protein